MHVYAYFCILHAYWIHISCISVHFFCIYYAYLNIFVHIYCIFLVYFCICFAYLFHILCIFMHIYAYKMHISCIFVHICCILYAYIMHISTYLGIFNAYFLHIFCIYVAHLHIWCHHDHFTMQIWIFLSASMLHPGQAGRCSWVDVTTSAVRSAATVDELLACQVRTYVCIFSLFLHILHI